MELQRGWTMTQMPVVRPSGDVEEPVSIGIRTQEDRGPQTRTCEAAVGMGGIG